ncbi:hypothetical protein [Sulfitobacter sp. R18_1]|uniref:hypothetical protein n=1 Tax=Sulfitobacter sp. R18_1 TaxID=2821104 RepID=UPI001ADD477E|nr:hypothetical protein [Sulfitobacter sp. R18_1]MBO9428247.1 hypothetical protein [Sulfitobacter sp. R18_1]
MPSVRLRPSVLKELRESFRNLLPGAEQGALNEAIACGLGFETHEDLRRALSDGSSKLALFVEDDFRGQFLVLSKTETNLNIFDLHKAITPLYGDDIQPTHPERITPSAPDEWNLVMVAAVNTAVRRGLVDLEVDYTNEHLGLRTVNSGVFFFDLEGHPAHCSFYEDVNENIYFEVSLDIKTDACKDAVRAAGTLERIDGLWLQTDALLFDIHKEQLDILKEIDVERPLGYGTSRCYDTLRQRRVMESLRQLFEESAQEIEDDFDQSTPRGGM